MSTAYSTTAWKLLRQAILKRDHYTCHWNLPGCTTLATQADHVRALAEGGAAYSPANLVASCLNCNAKRGRDLQNRASRLPSPRARQPMRAGAIRL